MTEIRKLGECAVVPSHLSSRYVMSITSKTVAGCTHIAFDTIDGLVAAMQIVAWAMGSDARITPNQLQEEVRLESAETEVVGFAYPF